MDSPIIDELRIPDDIEYLREIYKVAFEVSQHGIKAIGGHLCLLKLAPGGVHWIEGE